MSRLHQLLKGITALVITAALVVGVPAGLTVYVGWPLPTRIPTLEEAQLALRSGIDPQILIKTLAVIVWVAWAQLVVALTVEVAAVLRGRAARRAPVLPSIQAAAARLVTTITLVAATFAPLRPEAVLAQPVPATDVVHIDRSEPAAPPHQTDRPPGPPAVSEQETSRQNTYLVQRFDTLWGIAETTLGDGRRWQQIRDLNLGRHTSTGGEITTNTDHIPVGTRLLLPTDAHHPPSDDEPTSSKAHPEGEITVKEGDHFWKIAQTALRQAWGRQPTTEETASYWQQVVEANRDRLLPPHHPDLIYPGQVLRLPAIPQPRAVGPAQSSEGVTEPATGEVTVQQGDHFWKIAQTALHQAWDREPTTEETTNYWQQVVEANRDRLAPPHDPNLIYPGQVFHLPPIPDDPAEPSPDIGHDVEAAPTPEDRSQEQQTEAPTDLQPETATPDTPETAEATEPAGTPAEPPQQETSTFETSVPADTEPTDTEVEGDSLLPVVARLAGLGLLAAGVVALVDRLRRVQLRQRRPGRIPTPPPASAARTEAALRAAAAPGPTELVSLALRALAKQITETHIPPPQVVGVHLDSEKLRLLLWAPHHDPAPGWQVDDNGYSWTLPTTLDPTHLHLLADTVPAPYPALVTVGHGDGTQLLTDLEFAGAIQVTGEPDEVAATCYTMAIELAASPIADIMEVVCVGFGHDLAHLERITAVDSIAEILPKVEQVSAFVSTQDVTPLQGRLAPGGDGWAPLIILDPSPERPEGASQLLAAAHRGRAVCAVVGYPTGGQWRLQVSGGTIRIDPLGYTYNRRNLTPAEKAGIADLTLVAKDLEGIPEALADNPVVSGKASDRTEGDSRDTSTGETAVHSPPPSPAGAPAPLEVRTLGNLRVEGMTGRFPESKCLEIVIYLALHPHGVEADTLMEALYPDQQPDSHRLHDLVYRARRTLGADPNGELYLPHVASLYRLSPSVGCDLDRLTDHIRSAGQGPQAEEAHHLWAALELVEGVPFSGVKRGYGWAHTEGIISHATVAVDNTAHRLAELALGADEPDQATWAARKGLAVSWACEECYRNLMRAAIAQDDQTALEVIYGELIAIVDDDEGPDATGWLDPETVKLYEEHSRKRRRNNG